MAEPNANTNANAAVKIENGKIVLPGPDGQPLSLSPDELVQRLDDSKRTYEITVSGQKKLMTVAELQKAAELAEGAQQKMQAAAEAQKGLADRLKVADRADRIQALTRKMQNADPTTFDPAEFKELGTLLGVSDEVVNGILAQVNERIQGDSKPAATIDPALLKRVEAMEARQKAEDEAAQVQQKREEIRISIENTLDKDPLLGKIWKKEESDPQRKHVVKSMWAEVRRLYEGGTPFGPGLFTEAAATLRAELKDLGILKDGTGQAGGGNSEVDTVRTALGASMGLPTQVNVTRPPERVPATDDTAAYEKSMAERLLWRLARSGREA